jgi:hypothetical protein
MHGLWEHSLSINVFEFIASLWAEVAFSRLCPSASHLLSFTDNTADEWSMIRETPHAASMQLVSEKRAAFLRRSGLFARAGRVPSAGNMWADELSRQLVAKVLAEAAALGLTPVLVPVPPDMADLPALVAALLA